MEREVCLRIFSVQTGADAEPERTELFTQGSMHKEEDVWYISYEESELTGLQGTKTTFAVSPERIVLTRTGTLHSVMRFAVGEEYHCLYDMGFGSMMITVSTEWLRVDLQENGGCFEVLYTLGIESAIAGQIHYRIEITPK